MQLPVLVVLLVGLALVGTRGRRLGGRARSLALAGLGMLLLGTLLGAAWYLAIPSIVANSGLTASGFGPISLGVNTLLSIWHAAGLALLIGAAVSLAPRPAASTPTFGSPAPGAPVSGYPAPGAPDFGSPAPGPAFPSPAPGIPPTPGYPAAGDPAGPPAAR